MATDLMTRMEFLSRIVRDARVTRGDVAVAFVLLYRHYNADTGRCDPALSTIADGAALERRHAVNSVRHLEELGYFRVDVRGGTIGKFGPTNAYLPVFEAETPCTTVQGMHQNAGGEGMHHSASDALEGPRPPAPQCIQTSNILIEPVRARAALSKEETANGFETLWRIFPNRKPHPNPKKPARLKFEAALRRGIPAADIIAGAERYAAYAAQHEPNPRFWKQLVTWINQEGWTETHDQPEKRPLAVGMN